MYLRLGDWPRGTAQGGVSARGRSVRATPSSFDLANPTSVTLAAATRGAIGRIRRPDQHRLGAQPEHPLARASAARTGARADDAPVPRARAAGRWRAAAGGSVLAE